MDVAGLFVVFLVAVGGFTTWLSLLNVRHNRRAARREGRTLPGFEAGDLDEILDHQRRTTALRLVAIWFGITLVLAFLLSGTAQWLVEELEATPWPLPVRGAGFLVGLVVAIRLVSVPFGAARTALLGSSSGTVRERSESRLATWLVSTVEDALATALLGGGVLVLVELAPARWWLFAWALLAGLTLSTPVLYPRLVAPLFNEYETVDHGAVRAAVERVLVRAGEEGTGVYVTDVSSGSSRINAHFIGYGTTSRVVLYDTLIEQLSIPELESILAHELAHRRNRHVAVGTSIEAARLGIVLVAFQALIRTEWLYAAWGLPTDAVYAGFVLAGIWLYPLNRALSAFQHWVAFGHEYEADAFAVDLLGDSAALTSALAQVTATNLHDPFPHPLYALFSFEHPPLSDRIDHIRIRAGESESAESVAH